MTRFKLDFPFSRFLSAPERNKCKKEALPSYSSLDFADVTFVGFFPFSKALEEFRLLSSSPSFLITRGAQTQGHPIFKPSFALHKRKSSLSFWVFKKNLTFFLCSSITLEMQVEVATFQFSLLWILCSTLRKCQGSRVLGSFAIKGSSVASHCYYKKVTKKIVTASSFLFCPSFLTVEHLQF